MCPYCGRGFYNKQCLDVHVSTGTCGFQSLPRTGKGLYGDLSNVTENRVPRLNPPHPLILPVLPRIEYERQAPLYMTKLPIIAMIFENAVEEADIQL